MTARRGLGLILAISAYLILRERWRGMSFLRRTGESWSVLLADPAYLIPGLGALLAIIGGLLALAGGKTYGLATLGTAMVVVFMGLVLAMSGRLSFVEPFFLPSIGMIGATIGLYFTQQK